MLSSITVAMKNRQNRCSKQLKNKGEMQESMDVMFLIFLQKAIREIPQAGLINKQKSLILKEI